MQSGYYRNIHHCFAKIVFGLFYQLEAISVYIWLNYYSFQNVYYQIPELEYYDRPIKDSSWVLNPGNRSHYLSFIQLQADFEIRFWVRERKSSDAHRSTNFFIQFEEAI